MAWFVQNLVICQVCSLWDECTKYSSIRLMSKQQSTAQMGTNFHQHDLSHCAQILGQSQGRQWSHCFHAAGSKHSWAQARKTFQIIAIKVLATKAHCAWYHATSAGVKHLCSRVRVVQKALRQVVPTQPVRWFAWRVSWMAACKKLKTVPTPWASLIAVQACCCPHQRAGTRRSAPIQTHKLPARGHNRVHEAQELTHPCLVLCFPRHKQGASAPAYLSLQRKG